MRYYPNQKTNKTNQLTDIGQFSSGILHEIISEIGYALAKGQEYLDKAWIETQRERMKILLQSQADKTFVPDPAAFVIPEAKLDLNLEINTTREDSGKYKLLATPINAETKNKSKIDTSLSSKVSLVFKLVPENDEDITPSNTEVSALEVDQVLEIANDILEQEAKSLGLIAPEFRANYSEDSRKWKVELIDGPDVVALLIIDDSTGTILSDPIYFGEPSLEDLQELGPPEIHTIEPLQVSSGDNITITGDNLGALNIEETQVFLGGVLVTTSELNLKHIQFKVNDSHQSGTIQIKTDQGLVESNEQIQVLAKPTKLEPEHGFYNPINKEGSQIKVIGTNITPDTKLRFSGTIPGTTTPIEVNPTNFTSSTEVYFEIPSMASSGPISLVRNGLACELEGADFIHRPFINKIKPKEAKAGEKITITGNHFNEINAIKFGENKFILSDEAGSQQLEAYVSPQLMSFDVPQNAGDGKIILVSDNEEVDTGMFFFQIPSISSTSAYGIQGDITNPFEIEGAGFGKFKDSLQGMITEGIDNTYLHADFIDHENKDVEKAGFTIPSDLKSGHLRIFRTEIVSEDELDKTTTLSSKKALVFQEDTLENEILWCDPYWRNWKSAWISNYFTTENDCLKPSRNRDETLYGNTIIHSTNFDVSGELLNLENLLIGFRGLTGGTYFNFNFIPVKDRYTLQISFQQGGSLLQLNKKLAVPKIYYDKGDHLFFRITKDSKEIRFQFNDQSFAVDINYLKTELKLANFDSKFRPEIRIGANSYISWLTSTKKPLLQLPSFGNWEWDGKGISFIQSLPPIISSVSGNSRGEVGQTFTVTGSNFTETSRVFIGSRPQATTFNSSKQLTFKLYTNTYTGMLSVTDTNNPSLTAKDKNFVVLYDPIVHRVSKTEANWDEILNIYGTNLLGEKGLRPIVKFANISFPVVSASSTLIRVKAPRRNLINQYLQISFNEVVKRAVNLTHIRLSVRQRSTYDFISNYAQSTSSIGKKNIVFTKTTLTTSSLKRSPLIAQPVNSLTSKVSISPIFAKGLASQLKNIKAETNIAFPKVMAAYAPHPDYRYLQIAFPSSKIPSGAKLNLQYGFTSLASKTDGVRFKVRYYDTIAKRWYDILPTTYKDYDRKLNSISLDLTKVKYGGSIMNLTNRKGYFTFVVEPGSSNNADYSIWTKAQLEFYGAPTLYNPKKPPTLGTQGKIGVQGAL